MLGNRDLDVKRFVYHSTLWAAWRLVPSFLRTKVYQCLVCYGHETTSSGVTRLPFGLYAKHGHTTSVAEALATQYVSVNTTIPVPTILDVLRDSAGQPFILMTRVSGTPLADMPRSADDFSDAQVSAFADTIARWFAQLHQLPPLPHGPAICGFMGTPFMSYRIDYNECVGPFSSLDEFYRQHCTLPPQADPEMRALAKRIREKPYRIFFTHGDISSNNILVDENYLPVGLIDWECAAWMPEFWEFVSSMYGRQPYEGWVRIFEAVFPQYEEELAVEMELWNFVAPW